MKKFTIAAATVLAFASTSAIAGNTFDTGVADNDIIIPEVVPAGSMASMGSLGGGTGILIGLLGVAAVAAAVNSGGGS